jgi:hypothetical protein
MSKKVQDLTEFLEISRKSPNMIDSLFSVNSTDEGLAVW